MSVLNEVKSRLFPGTEFVVVEDWSCLDTSAVILKGTTVLTYKPRLLDRPFSGSLAGIEVSSLVATATAAKTCSNNYGTYEPLGGTECKFKMEIVEITTFRRVLLGHSKCQPSSVQSAFSSFICL